MNKLSYLPSPIISDKALVFVSQVTKEVADVPWITLEHTMTKHAETICMIERTHATLKNAPETEKRERRSMWHKFVNFPVLNYNTSYHTSIGCEPDRVF